MLPARLRLHLRSRPNFFSLCRVTRTPFFRAYTHYLNDKTNIQAAILVSKKTQRSAVGRHYTKRRLRQAFIEAHQQYIRSGRSFNSAVEIVIIAQAKLQHVSADQLRQDMVNLLQLVGSAADNGVAHRLKQDTK